MDNLSHSLVGLAAAELLQRQLPVEPTGERQDMRRRMLLFSCWAASNFPDLDLFLTPLLPAPLGYLLHHRGHTHTLLYAIPQALLLAGLLWLLWPGARKLLKESMSARLGLIGSIGTGLLLHLAMDYLNSYGIHPFHPFDSHWLYGDMVFILEPVFWIAFGTPLAMTIARRSQKIALLALLAGVPVFVATRGYLTWTSVLVLLLLAVITGVLQLRDGSHGKRGLLAGFALALSFIGVQGFASGQANVSIREALHRSDPASRVLDVATSAFPANSICWAFVSVEINETAGSYRLRRGILSLRPAILPVASCPPAMSEAPFKAGASASLAMQFEQEGSLLTLRARQQQDCHFAAWLRFARTPLLQAGAASDLRFGSDSGTNFSTIRFADFKDRQCSGLIPQWDYPRADLLENLNSGMGK